MPAVFITEPQDGTMLDYSKKVTIRWDCDPQGRVKSWKFYLGTQDGQWDLLMCELGNLRHIELEPHDLPSRGLMFAQVRGTYDGHDRENRDMEERVLSSTVHWVCPDELHDALDCCKEKSTGLTTD